MAIQNEWGGHDSLQKSHQLATDVLSWFAQSRGINLIPHFFSLRCINWFMSRLMVIYV